MKIYSYKQNKKIYVYVLTVGSYIFCSVILVKTAPLSVLKNPSISIAEAGYNTKFKLNINFVNM